MRIRNLLLLVVLILSILPLSAQEADTSPILTVNGVEVSAEEFTARTQFAYAMLRQFIAYRVQSIEQQAAQYGVEPEMLAQNDQQLQDWAEQFQNPTALGRTVLESLTEEIIMMQYAEANGITITEDDIRQMEYAFFGADPDTLSEEDAANFNEFVSYFRGEIEANADIALLEQYFERQALGQAVSEVIVGDNEYVFVQASHILVETEAEAQEVLTLLDEGASFAELAIERSLDPGSGQRGGDLGEAPALFYVPEFADAVINGELETILEPVETQFGFHIIIVHARETRPADENMLQQLQNAQYRNWTTEQFNNATVETVDNWPDYVYVPEIIDANAEDGD